MDDLLGAAGADRRRDPRSRRPRLRFGAPVPNPARDTVRIPLDVPQAGRLVVEVLDAQGRSVARSPTREVAAGSHAFAWSGRTPGGRRAAPGAYFVRARLGDFETTTRVVLR